MAKNVIITEDGHSKTISNAARIRTALEGGGTCDWIPKDDVPLQELVVTEDGVYDPEEGYYGFSQVTANGVGTVIEGTLIEKTVTKNGTYNITDENGNPYGYSKITVNVDTSDDDSGGGSGAGGDSPVVGKDEDGNDTMAEADDDGNIVMTVLPTEIKVIIPPTKLEYNRYEEIDYSGISVYAYISKAVHWLGTTATIISEGSLNNTVSIGGNSVTASVGNGVLYAPDRTGVNDIQLVWDGTKWVKPSNYSAEKAIWKSDKYPTGKIPFEELIFPIKRVNTDILETEQKAKVVSVGGYRGSINVSAQIDLKGTVDVYQKSTILDPNWNAASPAYYVPPYGPLMANGDTHVYAMGDTVVAARKIISVGSNGSPFNYSVMPYHPDHMFLGRCYGYGVIAASANNIVSFKIEKRTSRPYYREAYDRKWPLYPWNQMPGTTYEFNLQDYTGVFPDYNRYGPYLLGNNKDFADEIVRQDSIPATYTKNSKTVYYTSVSFGVYRDVENDVHVPAGGVTEFTDVYLQNGMDCSAGYDFIPDTVSAGEIAWAMIYGDDAEADTIPITLPVQWKRPGDGKILETTFTAWMTDEGGDNNTSGSTMPGSQNIDVPQ